MAAEPTRTGTSRTAAGPATRSAGGLVKPLILYALLSLIAARRTPAKFERNAHPDGRRPAIEPAPSTEEPRNAQDARAKESDRGRRATVPWEIPWNGWKDILWRTYRQIGEDRLLAVAAGVVFYGLLALFPAVTAFVSLYGLFAKTSTINEHLSLLGGLLPGGGVDIIREQVNRIAAKGETQLGFAFKNASRRR
jgi:hypothetical protein